ncbi:MULTISPECIES: ASCH domain-containing protein [unclassified Streptococcus]|uniref:ASCH domain-containing protein n=1 Tax=unclassified Streptococcus TaxID=2608887 RepID=UPI0018AC58FE|nr:MULTISPECIES: ASCH domain-containing protein [unclassified Streptococcus]MBF8970440.1 ASCH domain-containing protein [Streptococcus sp. NLN76]MBJ6746194.1 ASCH domain-containing protein [Streptococcus sp. 121]
MTSEISDYWAAFCSKKKLPPQTKFQAWSFGDSPKLADELADLVKIGKKTATTSALDLYGKDDPLPQIGEYNVILDGSQEPVCITQTKEVLLIPYKEITPDQARMEGEGDLSYAYWRKVHDAFFKPYFQEAGIEFRDDAMMVFEIFERID